MKIGVVGLGFVGLVTATVLADQGNYITCIDIDGEKVEKLNRGDLYIYEPGLSELFIKNKGRMYFSTKYAELEENDVTFVSVPTPTVKGKIDLSYVGDAVMSIASADGDTVIALKSTVVPGTARNFSSKIGRKMISNPEFLREGAAIHDTEKPDRIVIGGENEDYIDLVKKVWRFTESPILKTTNENAELIKYASNAFLATKISFINEIANLCEKVPGTDVNVVAEGMGMDHRIGKEFLRAGIGYGGSCLPKDTKAIVGYSKEKEAELRIVSSAIKVNDERVPHAVDIIEREIGNLRNKKIYVLGISFKNNTNDIRESKSLELVQSLEKKGAEVRVYDPLINKVDGMSFVNEKGECSDADCIVVASEWEEFASDELYEEGKKVIDLRRIVDLKVYPSVKGIGIYYE